MSMNGPHSIAPCLWFNHEAEDAAMMKMVKLDIAEMERAHRGA